MSKGQSLPFFAPPLLVEEKTVKDFKVIRMQQIGNKKEYIIKFEVSQVIRKDCVSIISVFIIIIVCCFCLFVCFLSYNMPVLL